MSGGSDGNKEFTEQLRMQQLYGQRHAGGSDPYTYTDPEDGTVYDWDHDRKAWFPKITEDFIANYQANYGFTKDGEPDANAAAGDRADPAPQGPKVTTPEQVTPDPSTEPKQKGEKRKPDPGWFDVDQDKNTNVYVSGLPLDISAEEFAELMSKCGIVMRDPVSEEYKVKLYKDTQGNLKGDGLCCYLKKESVALALRLIDESEVRGYKLHVEAAQFELKGQYDASKKKKKNKEYKKKMQQQQKQLDWRPEKQGEVRKRHEKVVIIQNMFHPSDFEEDPLVLNEYRDDLRTECEKFGQVKKVIIFDRHPDGVASVAFKEPEHGDACLLALDGRWFGGRKLSAQLWDGTTDYQVEETTREREERLKGWETFLHGAKKEGDQSAQSTEPAGSTTSTEPAGSTTSTEPAGSATSTEPAGSTTSTEPAGSTTSTEPAGSATSTGPAGSTTSTEPAGSTTSTEPAGSTTSTEPAGSTTSTEPVVRPPVVSEPARTASAPDADLVERTGNNPKTERRSAERQEEEVDSTDSSLAGSGDEEA